MLVIDKDSPRGKWNMGKIEDVYPGSDSLIRSVKVQIVDGSYNQPVIKLVMLLLKEEQTEQM